MYCCHYQVVVDFFKIRKRPPRNANDIKTHNEKVENLFLLIRSLITNSSKKSTNPLISDSNKVFYRNIHRFILNFWKEITITHNTVRDIQYEIENRINSNKLKFERKSGFLRLNGIHMTEGNDNELVEIQSNWIKIIK